MPRKTCTSDAWTQLTTSPGPASVKVVRESVGPLWLVAAAADPGAGVTQPGDAADYLPISAEFRAYQETILSGSALHLLGRAMTPGDVVTVAVTTVM